MSTYKAIAILMISVLILGTMSSPVHAQGGYSCITHNIVPPGVGQAGTIQPGGYFEVELGIGALQVVFLPLGDHLGDFLAMGTGITYWNRDYEAYGTIAVGGALPNTTTIVNICNPVPTPTPTNTPVPLPDGCYVEPIWDG
jgi:hypothetical protein